jgi:hypothetical protein
MSISRRVTLTKAQRSTTAGAELIALLAALSEDGMVTRDEMDRLKAWLEVDRGVEFEACAFLYEVVDNIAADGDITESELDSLALAIERVLPPETRKAVAEQRKSRLRALREQSIRARAEARTQERAAKLALREQTRVLHRGNFIVAGSRRSAERRDACELLDEGDAIVLEREPDNPHDRNAIIVLTAGGDELGYVPRDDAKQMAPLMDEGCFVDAEITRLLTETRDGIPLPIVASTIRRTQVQKATGAPAAAVPLNVARSSEANADTNAKPTHPNTATQLPEAQRPGCLTVLAGVSFLLVVAVCSWLR